MNLRLLLHLVFWCAALTSAAWIAPAAAAPVVLSDAGAAPADITDTVNDFRAALGTPNNGNAPGPLPSGRREINWDGGGPPVIDATPPVTPFNVFRDTRGASFTTPGTGLTQAADTGGGGSLDLINPAYAAAFAPFSPNRLFTPIGSNITDATFFIPGTNGTVPAAISGFGVVFTDVDTATSSSLEFFDNVGASLGTFPVPAGTTSDGSLSFLGVIFNAGEQITRVRITTGNSALGPADGPGIDVAVMDDVLYAEPRFVPEPSSLALLGLGLVGLGLVRRRR